MSLPPRGSTPETESTMNDLMNLEQDVNLVNEAQKPAAQSGGKRKRKTKVKRKSRRRKTKKRRSNRRTIRKKRRRIRGGTKGKNKGTVYKISPLKNLTRHSKVITKPIVCSTPPSETGSQIDKKALAFTLR